MRHYACKILFTLWLAISYLPMTCYAEGTPVFGSMAAGEPGLNLNLSDIKPKLSLHEPGTLQGRWISNKIDILEVVSDSSGRNDFNSKRYCTDFKDDCFVVKIKGSNIRPLPLTAAYGSFNIYGVDTTGEGVDSIIIESGQGRGTSVHVRSVKIYRIRDGHFVPIFIATLNGYLSYAYNPANESLDPLSWERYYYFKSNKQNNSLNIVLELCSKPETMFGVSKLDDLLDIQARKIVNAYDKKKLTYYIDKIELGF